METPPVPPYRPSIFLSIYEWLSHRIDLSSGWDRLPRYTGALVLGGLRTQLRRTNLYDTSKAPSNQPPPPGGKGDRHLTARTVDGSFNDLQVPEMGRAGTRFGRNVPLQKTFPQNERLLLRPSPRVVSRQLLTRERFIPATSLNLLAGAWLQFMVHDWLSHGKNQKHNPWRIELEPDDDWPQRPMHILRTRRDPTLPDRADGQPPTFINTASPWWDASQLYGNDEKTEAAVRAGEGGKLRVEPNRLLPVDPKTGVEITGV
jgi:hypothetical protein